jgi:hypothetical protein
MLKDNIKYIALSSDRRRFMDLESIFNPARCMQGKTLICPTSSPILTEPTADCLFHLIAGNLKMGKEETKCELTEIKTDEVFLQSIDVEEWVLSSPTTVMLQPSCINLNDSVTPTITMPRIEVKGDMLLHVPRQCSVVVGHHIIPTRLLMSEDLGKVTNKMVVPNLHTHQLLDLHGAQLIEEKLDEELNNIFKDMLEEHHKRALTINTTSHDVKQLMKAMMKETHDAEMMKPNYNYHAITWSTLAFIGVGVAAVVYWVWKVWKRPPVIERSETVREIAPQYIVSSEPLPRESHRKRNEREETTPL